MARFLQSLLTDLPRSYAHNNYYKLYQEIFDEFKKITDNIEASTSKTKTDVLSGIDSLSKQCDYIREVLDERTNTLKRVNFWQLLKTLSVPLCITCPSNMDRERFNLNMGGNKKGTWSPDKIEVIVKIDKGCIHERMSIMRELATSNERLVILPH